jgi:hypothetical protein
LCGVTEKGLELLATHNCADAPPTLLQTASACLRADEATCARQTSRETTITESGSTASETLSTPQERAEARDGFYSLILRAPHSHAGIGLLLLCTGASAPRPAETKTLELIADALISAGDVLAPPLPATRASPETHGSEPPR